MFTGIVEELGAVTGRDALADAARLTPSTLVLQARTLGDIRERAVAIVLKQMAVRLLAMRKTFQAPAIHQK